MICFVVKNYKDVIVVVDIKDYDFIIEKLKIDIMILEDRKKLLYKVFLIIGRYDVLIFSYFVGEVGDMYFDILNLIF